MAQKVLHAGQMFELGSEGWTKKGLAETKEEVLVYDQDGSRKILPAQELRWVEEGELERELHL